MDWCLETAPRRWNDALCMPKWGSTITGYFPPRLGVPVLHMLWTNMSNDPTQAIPALVPIPDPIPARPVWDYLLNSAYVRVQELCEGAGGRLAPSLLILSMVSLDGKQHELHERKCPPPIPGRTGNSWPDGVWQVFAVCHLTWHLYVAGPFPW